MAVGILLVTHEGIATALHAVAQRLVAPLPLHVEVLEVPFDVDVGASLAHASAALRRADGGDGVLVLTDVYGATPSNLAARIAQLGTPVRRVSGASIPMLLRVLNYAELDLDGLAGVAAVGGRNGVQVDEA